MLCQESIPHETRSSYHHIYHDVFVKGKLVRSTCLGCNWFILGKNEKEQHVHGCVSIYACVSV